MTSLKPPLTAGIVLGIWLAWLYAFISNEANRVILRGIALPDPPGGVVGYYLGAIAVGAIVGLLSVWPKRLWLGILAGSAAGALLTFLAPWKPSPIPAAQIARSLDLIFNQFFPIAFSLLPFTLLLRISARQLSSNAGGAQSLLRIGLPLVTTGIVAAAGVLSLYPADARDAFSLTQKLVDEGLQASHASELSQPLQSVQGFIPNANGRYTLELSYELDRFQGPQLTTVTTATNFLIVARFKNGFTMACNFAPSVTTPPCANFH
jgi:hypothetical protein